MVHTPIPDPPARYFRFLRLPAVEDLTGLKRSSIYLKIKDGTFPKPSRISARAVGWPEHLILAWLAERINSTNQLSPNSKKD